MAVVVADNADERLRDYDKFSKAIGIPVLGVVPSIEHLSAPDNKQKKKEERLSGGSRSFEDMLAYVDENGVLHTTPQDVKPKEEIDASQIEISVPRQSEIEEEEPMSGRVEYFTASKGYGFIKDAAGSEKYFFHITNAPAGIAEGDRVTFELERGTRGMNAVRIVISNK